jgi:hypothetical protein
MTSRDNLAINKGHGDLTTNKNQLSNSTFQFMENIGEQEENMANS